MCPVIDLLLYILQNNSIVSLVDGNGHKLFEGVLEEPWLNLACSVYLSNHNSICDGQTLQRLRDTFSNTLRLLGWVRLGDKD